MNLRTITGIAVFGFIALVVAVSNSRDTQPNIIVILADDLGYRDLGSYGHPYAETPNLDQLAAEGTRFQQAYAAGATCTPSRTGFMTGKFPATFEKRVTIAGFGSRVTVTDLLRLRGYRTGHVGKWNIGPTREPGTYGIDEISSIAHAERGQVTADMRGRDARVFDEAIEFIERNQNQPFYLNVWARTAHHPVNPPPRYAARFQDLTVNPRDFSPYMHWKFNLVESKGADLNQAMRKYLGAVYSLDEDVGRLLAKLDQLDLAEDTIVVFTSDHGPARVDPLPRSVRTQAARGNAADEKFRVNMLGYAGDLRGSKHTDYEGGVRVPFIVRWPGRVPAGRVDQSSVINGVDWLPTLSALTDSEIDGEDIDGEDVSSAWLGKEYARRKPMFWRPSETPDDASMRDGKWKLHVSGAPSSAIELYDLSIDSGERNNIAGTSPEVVERLGKRIAMWAASLPSRRELR